MVHPYNFEIYTIYVVPTKHIIIKFVVCVFLFRVDLLDEFLFNINVPDHIIIDRIMNVNIGCITNAVSDRNANSS